MGGLLHNVTFVCLNTDIAGPVIRVLEYINGVIRAYY